MRCTNEKERSAAMLGSIFESVLQPGMHLLDIGAGNGEHLDLILSTMAVPKNLTITAVEPSADMTQQLRPRLKKHIPARNLHLLAIDLEHLTTEETFDIILISHLFYHVPPPRRPALLIKIMGMLKPGGKLIIVVREKDDTYDFKMTFKPLLFGSAFQSLLLKHILGVLPHAENLRITRYTVPSQLTIPLENRRDTIAIIEFFLSKNWEEMPLSIQRSALAYVEKRSGVFNQLEGIAVIEKVH